MQCPFAKTYKLKQKGFGNVAKTDANIPLPLTIASREGQVMTFQDRRFSSVFTETDGKMTTFAGTEIKFSPSTTRSSLLHTKHIVRTAGSPSRTIILRHRWFILSFRYQVTRGNFFLKNNFTFRLSVGPNCSAEAVYFYATVSKIQIILN